MRLLALFASLLAAGCVSPAAPRRLVVATPSGALTLVPDATNEEFTLMVFANIYESLVDFDSTLKPVPQLAETWYMEDDLTWVFRLRAGALFHDGRPVEAGDVVRSLERARTHPDSRRRGELSVIESFEQRDGRSVVIRTRKPYGALPHRLAAIAIWRPASSPELPPLGTGPYGVASWRPGGDALLSAFDRHLGGAPPIREVEFRVVGTVEERLRLLRQGSVHLVLDPPAETLASLSGTPSVRLVGDKGLRVIFLGLQCARPPFDDPRLRRAVALAIDRQALVRGPLAGRAELVEQMVAPAVFGYDASLPAHPHDPAEARRLVAASAYSADSLLPLEYMPLKYRSMPAVAQRIAADLGAVGLRAELKPRETADLFARIERHEPTLYLMGWTSSGGDAAVSYNYLLRTPAEGYGSYNGGGYSNPELDRLLDRAATLLDHPRRNALLARVARIAHDEVAAVPLYVQTDLYAVHQDVVFTPRLDRRVQAATFRWR